MAGMWEKFPTGKAKFFKPRPFVSKDKITFCNSL